METDINETSHTFWIPLFNISFILVKKLKQPPPTQQSTKYKIHKRIKLKKYKDRWQFIPTSLIAMLILRSCNTLGLVHYWFHRLGRVPLPRGTRPRPQNFSERRLQHWHLKKNQVNIHSNTKVCKNIALLFYCL